MELPIGPQRIRLGIALTTNPTSTKFKLREFCEALGAASGLTVTGEGLWSYQRLLDAMQAGDIDLAWLPPILALAAIERGEVRALALPVRGGVASYSTALFTREDSEIVGLDDLVGRRAAWVDPQSAAGYLVIRAFLRSRGVDLERAFTSESFVGNYDAVTRAVVEGRADVGATFIHLGPSDEDETELGVIRAGWGSADVRMVAHAGPIPSDVVVAKSDTPAAVVEAIQGLLVDGGGERLRSAAATLFSAEGFIVPTAAHLDPLAALLRA
jgi:phosphonate transport system substrate-binding protein